MIRMIQRRLIIPRGDTGSFSVPYLKTINTGDVAVFTIFDIKTNTKLFQKIIRAEGDNLTIAFSHGDTVNLKPGKYFWDIKYYTNPQIADDILVDGEEIDSYYAGFTLPECEIRETGDNWLVAENQEYEKLSPLQINIVSALFGELKNQIDNAEIISEHYPKIINSMWYVWDKDANDFVNTGVPAAQDLSNYMQFSDMQALTNEEIDTIIEGGASDG